MKLKQIQSGIDAIISAMDFISSNTDSDETGIGREMMNGLSELKISLQEERYKNNRRSRLAKVRRECKK